MPAAHRFTHGEINRAGDRIRGALGALGSDDPAVRAFLDHSELAADLLMIDQWRGDHARSLVRVNAGLRHYIRKAGPSTSQVSQRLKRLDTIVDKLDRQPKMDLSRMEDIGGVRVILPRQREVDAVVRSINQARAWNVRRVRRYVEGGDPGPKSDGYRAVHMVIVKDQYYVEVQFRTPWQDAWAQSVEQDTRRLGAGLKFGSGPPELREHFKLLSEFFRLREQGVEPSQELMEELAKSYDRTRRFFSTEPTLGPP